MKCHNGLTDDDGVKWEFLYEEDPQYKQNEETGKFEYAGTVIRDLTYKREGDEFYTELPSWADIRNEWKINLCFFDEDEETEELTFWEITP